jgi:diguanylate cyclase (GGDEF)-like protein/PAS domain S-box-containing protein
MTIRNKILYIVMTTCFTLIIITYTTTHIFLLGRFSEIEKRSTHLDLQRFLDALENDLNNLNKVVVDWADWDDTYRFIETKDPNYIKENLLDEAFTDLQLNLIFYLNPSGEVVYGKVFDLETGREKPSISFQKQIVANQILLQNTDLNRTHTGIILSSHGPLLIAYHPILTSERKGPSHGTLVMGRFLNHTEINKLAQITHLPVKITLYSKLQTDSKFHNLTFNKATPILIRALNNNEITGYALINDISQKPALIASIKLVRTIYRQAQVSIFYFIVALLGISVILVLLVLMFLKKEVVSRLDSFNNCINSIADSNDLSVRMPINGRDELNDFAQIINRMMSSLERFHNKLEESHQQLVDIIEFLPDATFVIDQNQKIVAWNRAIEEMTGVKKEEILGKGDYAYSIPFYENKQPLLINLVDCDEVEIKRYYKNVQKKGSVLFAEVNVIIFGKPKSLWITASPLFNKNSELMGAIESIRDISERKEAEADLIYLSLHDQLTGLYNRAHFEEEIHRLNGEQSPIVGIIMCDVDGLKLINDSLGHQAGDKLLQSAAHVIKKAFRDNDLVARVGGDEFAIVLPNADGTLLELACSRIQKTLMNYNKSNPELPLSISMGWSFRKKSTVSLKHVFEEADNNMYHEKLLRHQSAHSAIVQTLMKTLSARDFITEGHADRMKVLVVNLSRHLGLSDRRINDITLLAQFHDIGKLGIPDNILFKKGPLNPEEKETMQRHAEIGYNIAKSAKELQHISDWILWHHEWWNGNGYPRGLKGETIPLECRILAIVDAYDAMTNDRPYRKALSKLEALQELHKCAGTQFDPKLVTEFLNIIK